VQNNALPHDVSQAGLALLCIYVGGFVWSWGPLTCLVSAEIQPLETRSAAFSLAVFINMMFTFLIGQTFLTMMCGESRHSTFSSRPPACTCSCLSILGIMWSFKSLCTEFVWIVRAIWKLTTACWSTLA